MKHLAPLVLAIPLLLAGCSDTTETTSASQEKTTTEVTAETTSGAAEEEDGPALANIGEPISFTCFWNDCLAEVTITDIAVGEECRYGVSDYGEGYNQSTEGKEILQLWGELSVTKGSVGSEGQETSVSVDEPTGVLDAEGFIQTPSSYQCRDANDGHEYWMKPIDAGQKTRIYGDYLIPAGATAVVVEGHTLALPGREIPEDYLQSLPSKSDLEPVDMTASGEHVKDYVLVQSMGTLGIYYDNKENNYRLCDSRGVVTFDIMNSDGCSDAMGYEELLTEFEDSWERDLEAEFGTEAPQIRL